MIIGVPKEVKNHEYRVGLVPSGVREYVRGGHSVFVERGAGEGSAISDEAYEAAGATILETAAEVWRRAEMIVKVKEPLPSEFELMQQGQIIYTFFHLAAVPDLATVMLDKQITALAYETIQLGDGRLPLLEPMSEVAGRMAIQVGARSLERESGGKGILLGGVPGVRRARVVILGGGVVGMNAAKMAIGLGAYVTIIDISLNRLRFLDDIFGSRIQTLYSNSHTISQEVRAADLVIGAVLIPGARAPRLVSRELIGQMENGSVVVDVAVDQGGCIETCRPTTHENPTFVVDGVVHYCVSNMPGGVARTSTFALHNATLPYGIAVANKGLERALQEDVTLRPGVNTYRGEVVHAAVAEALNLGYTPLSKMHRDWKISQIE